MDDPPDISLRLGRITLGALIGASVEMLCAWPCGGSMIPLGAWGGGSLGMLVTGALTQPR